MTLYELDPVDEDELVQTMYFPSFTFDLDCDVWGCDRAEPLDENSERIWVTPSSYDSPSDTTKVSAELSVTVNRAWFTQHNERCEQLALIDPGFNCN